MYITTWANGCHFCGRHLKCVFLNENVQKIDKNSLKCVPGGLIDDKSTLVGEMLEVQSGNKLFIICFR